MGGIKYKALRTFMGEAIYVNDVDFIVVGVCYRSPDADENEKSIV